MVLRQLLQRVWPPAAAWLVAWGLWSILGQPTLFDAEPTVQLSSSTPDFRSAPVLERRPIMAPVASSLRATPPDITRTAGVVRPPWNLGLRLVGTRRGSRWSAHRAIIERRADGDSRSYAIGDLLPYGSVLVAVSTGAVQLMVGDEELVYLDVAGDVRSVQDFRTAYERAPLRRAPDDKALEAALAEILPSLRSRDPAEVQGAIDALIEAGGPAVGWLVPFATSELEVVTTTVGFVFAGSAARRARVHGDLIVGILQAVTGQSFGDPMAPDLSDDKRLWIRQQWLRWWGATAQPVIGSGAENSAPEAATASVSTAAESVNAPSPARESALVPATSSVSAAREDD